MIQLPQSIENLIAEIQKLPSIGYKTAQRLAFYILKQPQFYRDAFAHSILQSHEYHKCSRCACLSENTSCPICDNDQREMTIICVVEEFLDLYAIEQSGGYKGKYHILEGVLSPLDNISADDIRMKELFDRLDSVKEVIIATNTTLEGEATALYIKEKIAIQSPHVIVTRIARGLPMGADLEFADRVTLQSAFDGRKVI